MAKKRKAPKTFGEPQSTKLTKFNIEERFDDSEDDFYAGRDKVLLEESADTKRRRRMIETEKDLQPSDEEILGYTEEDDSENQEYSDSAEQHKDYDGGVTEQRRGVHSKPQNRDSDDDELSEDEQWGTERGAYYDADVIETEADALEEEKEAKRLHQKHVKTMTEADFGFDDSGWVEEKQEGRSSKVLKEKLPEIQIPKDATNGHRLQILQNRYPELQPLAEDFLELQRRKEELDAEVLQMSRQISRGGKLAGGLPVSAKRNALTAYLASISMYFAIISSNTNQTSPQTIGAMPPLELHEHAVIQSLTKARQLWDRVADEETAGLEPIRQDSVQDGAEGVGPKVEGAKKRSLPNGNQAGMMTNRKRESTSLEQLPVRKSQDIGAKSQKSSERSLGSKISSNKSKSGIGGKKLDLDTLMKEAVSEDVSAESDFGDEHPLTQQQYAEKDRKRKSLRFYTSQIASKANRRGHASREAGGDDDLPHKERQRDRQERLIKAAEARGKGTVDDFEDGIDDDAYDDMPNSRRQDENDDYYNTLLNATQKKKSDRNAKAEAYAAAAKEGAHVYEEESVGPDGKRAITYAIAKNKGLAPKRKKDVRNPRVKKRKKFDEKMKKLGSMKQVYKGGEGRGGYGGELTGIKTNIVKSVKL